MVSESAAALPTLTGAGDDVFRFNERLESEAELSTLNESLLETRLRDLDDLRPLTSESTG